MDKKNNKAALTEEELEQVAGGSYMSVGDDLGSQQLVDNNVSNIGNDHISRNDML